MTLENGEPMLTTKEAARVLGLSDQTILNFIRDGSLAAINVARAGSRRPRYAVTGNSLNAFLVARRVTATTKR